MSDVLPPWSYSFISCFDSCPRMAHGKYILRIKEPETEALKHGNAVHKALENYVSKGEPLRPEYLHWEGLANSIRARRDQGAVIEVEKKLGVRKDFSPSGFFDRGVYGRGVVDILMTYQDKAWIGDWKTGKVKENGMQVGIFAAFVFTNYPQVQQITAHNIWLQNGKPGMQYDYNRSALPQLWENIIPRIHTMEMAAVRDHWPEKPSGLCGWCPVRECRYNPRRVK